MISTANVSLKPTISFILKTTVLENAITGGTCEGDIEKVIENIIYQHLIRLGYQVYVGQLQVGEIDFVESVKLDVFTLSFLLFIQLGKLSRTFFELTPHFIRTNNLKTSSHLQDTTYKLIV